MGRTPKEFDYDYFEIRDGRLYYEDMNRPLMTKDADEVGWVSQNLWALVVGTGVLLYTYIVTK